jgi:hypothetical protein
VRLLEPGGAAQGGVLRGCVEARGGWQWGGTGRGLRCYVAVCVWGGSLGWLQGGALKDCIEACGCMCVWGGEHPMGGTGGGGGAER